MDDLKRYVLILKQLVKWFFKNVINLLVVAYCTVAGKHHQRRSIYYRELIALQNILSFTDYYWRRLDRQYSSGIDVYRNFVEANSYGIVRERQVDFIKSLDRVLQNDNFDSLIGAEKNEELTWVMSTGRCGVDALDRYFKLSAKHFSIHREFHKDEMFYEHRSTWTTKSRVLHKFFYNNASDEEIKLFIETFLGKRMKTIRRREGKQWIFCEHCDTVWLPVILRLFPFSKIVFLSKNPKDVITSYMSKQQYSSAQEMPLPPEQDKLPFKTLFGLMCWFYTYINMFIDIHCDLIGNGKRILRVNGKDLMLADPTVHKELNKFLNLDITEREYQAHFAGRYNSKAYRSRYSRFPSPDNWPNSYRTLLELFFSTIKARIRH